MCEICERRMKLLNDLRERGLLEEPASIADDEMVLHIADSESGLEVLVYVEYLLGGRGQGWVMDSNNEKYFPAGTKVVFGVWNLVGRIQ